MYFENNLNLNVSKINFTLVSPQGHLTRPFSHVKKADNILNHIDVVSGLFNFKINILVIKTPLLITPII
jgi:hypothetical protein